MKKKLNISLVILIMLAILIMIIIVATYNAIILNKQNKEIDKFIEYVNSTEKGSELQTPELTHVVLAAYKGEASGLKIVKTIMYYANNNIPEIHEKCSSKFSSKRYYKAHKIQIYKQLGIDNFDDFYVLAEKCMRIKNTGNIESIRFDYNSVKIEDDGVSAVLCIRYEDSDEVSFNVKILNSTSSNQTSINIR